MRQGQKRSRRLPLGGAAPAVLLCALALVPRAQAAGPPIVLSTFSSAVFSSTARLQGQINPNGLFTTYHFDYITEDAYDANIAAATEPFTGAARTPIASDANLGSGSAPVSVLQQASGLQADTEYRYRVVAKNTTTVTGPTKAFVTQAAGGSSVLADGRGWEMVSPVAKNGGEVAARGAIAGGGVLQASAQGGSITYGSEASFAGGQGAPPASQYLATRTAGGWATENLTAPIFSGSYDAGDAGVPYQLFSPDLARGILLNGDHCRGEGSDCAVANPPLAGTDAPAGYQNYYLREGGAYTALLGGGNAGFLSLEPEDFDLQLAGSSADLLHPVLATCAALTANATEVPLGEGCDPQGQNLYLYAPGTGLSLVNLLPFQSNGTPGAELASQAGAISADGSHVYWTDTTSGNLYVRISGQTTQVDDEAGGGGSFETASADGSIAFFSKGGHLWRYVASTDTAADLTPAGGVVGMLATSASGSVVYYQDASGLERWSGGATTTVAAGAEAAEESSWPPASGTARTSEDGSELLFASKEQLTGYDNTDLKTGNPDPEVFLYANGGDLTCVSCNPTLGRPIGPSSLPGSIPNGTAAGSTDAYKPRILSTNGRRAFFDSSDALALADTNSAPDAYQWEAQGEGSCGRAGGCISLISDGRSAGGSSLVDASADGADAFFLTAGSLVKADPGAADLYDARIGGGFAEAGVPAPCEGDACQPLPSPPQDPTLTTLLSGPGNPPVRFPKTKCRKHKPAHGCTRKHKPHKKGKAHSKGGAR